MVDREHVSIVTAHQVNAALAETHDVIPIYITKDGAWLTGDKLKELTILYEQKSPHIRSMKSLIFI